MLISSLDNLLAKGYTYTLYGQSVTGTAVLATMGDGSTDPYLIIGEWYPGASTTPKNQYKWESTIKSGSIIVPHQYNHNIHSYADYYLWGSGKGGWVRFLPTIYFEKGKYKYCRIIANGSFDHNDDGDAIGERIQTVQVGLSTNPNVSSISQCDHVIINYSTPNKYSPLGTLNRFIDISNIPSNNYFLFIALLGCANHIDITDLWFTNNTNK